MARRITESYPTKDEKVKKFTKVLLSDLVNRYIVHKIAMFTVTLDVKYGHRTRIALLQIDFSIVQSGLCTSTASSSII